MVVVTIAALYLGIRANFDPTIGTGPADLCLRGGDHRRPRLALGNARRRHRHRRRADRRRRDQSGMADARRPSRLPRWCCSSGRAACSRVRWTEDGERGLANAPGRSQPRTRPLAGVRGMRCRASLVLLALAAPLFVSRSVLQDLFFILTMLVLAQNWNLLAGYAGLVSVGQQAFVGFGAYAMFALVDPARPRSARRILLGGIAGALLAIPTAFFVFRLQGAYFAIGTWVIAEVVRLALAQWKAARRRHRHLAAARRDPRHGRRRAGSASCFGVRAAQAADIVCLLAGAAARRRARSASSTGLLRSRQGLALAAVRDNAGAAALRRRRRAPHEDLRLSGRRLRHRPGRRADLCAEGAHLAGRRLLGRSTGPPMSSSSS